ncbi:MAG TPA: hypothetical protein PLX89_08810 [Verrucomicrobiota bacterium]|nr:hypothetical protein [Verrucomicrobiales bacterium]HRI13093.1 hypothetical protein [Verrucomicrobiota bacterium]
MQPPVLIALGLLTMFSRASAQGWFGALNNYFLPGTTTQPFILDQWGNPASRFVGRVEIIDAATGNTLSRNGKGGVALTFDGIFYAGAMQVPGSPVGSSANLVVLAWDSTTGPTWAEATTRSGWLEGQVTICCLSSSTTPVPTFEKDSNFEGLQFQVVPEPSASALAAVGFASLFLVSRFRG